MKNLFRLFAVLLVMAASTAQAQTSLGLSLNFGAPAPVYVQPAAPVYYHRPSWNEQAIYGNPGYVPTPPRHRAPPAYYYQPQPAVVVQGEYRRGHDHDYRGPRHEQPHYPYQR